MFLIHFSVTNSHSELHRLPQTLVASDYVPQRHSHELSAANVSFCVEIQALVKRQSSKSGLAVLSGQRHQLLLTKTNGGLTVMLPSFPMGGLRHDHAAQEESLFLEAQQRIISAFLHLSKLLKGASLPLPDIS